MRERTWKARVAKIQAEEAQKPVKWWYLSFAGEEGFRGGLFLKGRGFADCIRESHNLGLNPGGEVMIMEVPKRNGLPAANYRYKLLDKKELQAAFREKGGIVLAVNGRNPDSA